MQLLFDRINQYLDSKDFVTVAIDGNAAAGKSTLAAALNDIYSCNVIPMDHFFLRPDQRTPERLSEPGGNIDYDSFIDHIITPLQTRESFVYYPYDCKLDKPGEPITVNPNKLTVIEGVYSMHPLFFDNFSLYDITVFLSIDETEQHRRLFLRNEHLYNRFINEWIPMENMFFDSFNIAEKCDFMFNGSCNYLTNIV